MKSLIHISRIYVGENIVIVFTQCYDYDVCDVGHMNGTIVMHRRSLSKYFYEKATISA